METSLPSKKINTYVLNQLSVNFPDSQIIKKRDMIKYTEIALERLEYCLSHVSINRYRKGNLPFFNHLDSDSYCLFLCFLGNTIWKESGDEYIASKVYYLNKVMHSFECMYNTGIPDIFLIIHGVGSIMGKAKYNDYFVIYQRCTIGATSGIYPEIGKGCVITSGSSIIGNCLIGDRVTIGTGTTIYNTNVSQDQLVYFDYKDGITVIKHQKIPYVNLYFNI